PAVPNSNNFIVANITSVVLNLERWNNGLCPILNFAIRYRPKDMRLIAMNEDSQQHHPYQQQWITVSNHLRPEFGAIYIIQDLLPESWYELSIIATNDAGETESRYLFATLTLDGGTVEPLYSKDALNRRPTTCAILVLLVIGGATIFIFITRICRHRDANQTDQLSMNLFSKTYSKSDLMLRSGYDVNDPNKLTQIETLNCGQNELLDGIVVSGSQYVEGPTSLTYTTTSTTNGTTGTIDDSSSNTMHHQIITAVNGSPSLCTKLNKSVPEGLYSTPCIQTHQNDALSSMMAMNFVQQQQHQTPQNCTLKTPSKTKLNKFPIPESIYGTTM
ncbi:Fibronectin type III domain containing protein 6, partial [Sarcoptes scabiei]